MAVISDTQGNFQVDLIVDETSSDIITNTSTATWKLRLKTLSGTSYMYGTPTIIINSWLTGFCIMYFEKDLPAL